MASFAHHFCQPPHWRLQPSTFCFFPADAAALLATPLRHADSPAARGCRRGSVAVALPPEGPLSCLHFQSPTKKNHEASINPQAPPFPPCSLLAPFALTFFPAHNLFVVFQALRRLSASSPDLLLPFLALSPRSCHSSIGSPAFGRHFAIRQCQQCHCSPCNCQHYRLCHRGAAWVCMVQNRHGAQVSRTWNEMGKGSCKQGASTRKPACGLIIHAAGSSTDLCQPPLPARPLRRSAVLFDLPYIHDARGHRGVQHSAHSSLGHSLNAAGRQAAQGSGRSGAAALTTPAALQRLRQTSAGAARGGRART